MSIDELVFWLHYEMPHVRGVCSADCKDELAHTKRRVEEFLTQKETSPAKPKCQYCDKIGVGFPIEYVDYSPGKPWCCKDHRNQITRASKRRELVYKYLEYGVEQANTMAAQEIPDGWVPEGWEK